MNWKQFQSEMSFLWSDETGSNYNKSHADEVKGILHLYSHELGLMELKGATKKQQMAAAWKFFKKEFPHLVQ